MSGVPIFNQLEQFWGWHPPILERHAKHTKSKNTRLPSHYDMHLDERLRLKRIVPLPSLLTDLETVADKAVVAAPPDLLQIKQLNEFPHEGTRKAAMCKVSVSMLDEQGVADFYMNTTAKFCAPVASMLGLQHCHWQSSLIWDRQTHQRGSAIADGFLKINAHVHDDATPLLSPLKPEVQSGLDAIVESKLPHLAVWEFKSLVAGSLNVMQAIDSIKGPFKWLSCQEEALFLCGTDSKHLTKEGKLTTTGSPMGFDALKPPWDINEKTSRGCKRKRKLNQAEDGMDYEDDGNYEDDLDGDHFPLGDIMDVDLKPKDLEKAHSIIQQVILFILS